MSSGNLTADRRFDYARMLRDEGDHRGAAELIAQALELAPAWAEGRFAYAEALAESGDRAGAATAYRHYLSVDPTDSMGAAVRLALLDGADLDALPQAYVRRLFDDYAPRFDEALVKRLAYTAPAKLRAAIVELAPQRRFAATLDLGCGTGLAGVALRDITTWLEGVDRPRWWRKPATSRRTTIWLPARCWHTCAPSRAASIWWSPPTCLSTWAIWRR